jgi:hypothetical protein
MPVRKQVVGHQAGHGTGRGGGVDRWQGRRWRRSRAALERDAREAGREAVGECVKASGRLREVAGDWPGWRAGEKLVTRGIEIWHLADRHLGHGRQGSKGRGRRHRTGLKRTGEVGITPVHPYAWHKPGESVSPFCVNGLCSKARLRAAADKIGPWRPAAAIVPPVLVVAWLARSGAMENGNAHHAGVTPFLLAPAVGSHVGTVGRRVGTTVGSSWQRWPRLAAMRHRSARLSGASARSCAALAASLAPG